MAEDEAMIMEVEVLFPYVCSAFYQALQTYSRKQRSTVAVIINFRERVNHLTGYLPPQNYYHVQELLQKDACLKCTFFYNHAPFDHTQQVYATTYLLMECIHYYNYYEVTFIVETMPCKTCCIVGS